MKKTYIILVIILVLLSLLIFFWFRSPKIPEGEKTKVVSQEASTTPEDINGVSQEVKEPSPEVKEVKAALEPNVSATRYENKKYGFSFDKPEGYTVGILPDALGETLLVQNLSTNIGFQIYITPLDGPTSLTKEQIKIDLPDMSVINDKTIKLDNQADGIMFESNNSSFGGQSFELWFTYNGFLYQISTYKNFAEELQKIIGTWKFLK